jgi:hypothetical protein
MSVDIVDDGKRGAPAVPCGLGICALLGREVGLQHESHHANDSAYRRANFMAHVGQNLRFSPRATSAALWASHKSVSTHECSLIS